MSNDAPRQGRHRLSTTAVATTALATILAGGLITAAPPATAASPADSSGAGITGAVEPATAVGATPVPTESVAPEVAVAQGETLGAVTDASQDGASALFTTERGAIRITYLSPTTFRVEAVPGGDFTNPANSPSGDPARTANIVVGADDFPGASPTLTEGENFSFGTDSVTVTVDGATGRMSAYRADGTVLWEEAEPLSFADDAATQHLVVHDGEQFLGGGMQNGRSIHTGATINVSVSYDWDDGGHPNAVPYYMSSAGYGVLRNTFAPGTYDFAAGTTTHAEGRFDAYYFAGGYKESLDSYTKLTGRPMMPPVYALEYGDADCYNRSNPDYSGSPVEGKMHTPDALHVAEGFVEHNMPGGWMLVNDGYGCGYTQLPDAVQSIQDAADLQVGLWTENDLANQEFEVAEAGIRLRKLDVAWVGAGYRMALSACEKAHQGIEQYSQARGTVLMVEGWAGAQRCGMQWTGDHSGSLDAIRWQISALTGAGNSGMPFTTGDIDGIFGGSMESYVRDLQWKAFAPALYSMSGWAATDKRPWLYGETATEINRFYLQLRQQLMPYIYDLAQNAHASGTPLIRSIAIEYPQDPGAYSVEANTEFLLGEDFLVAPVFTDTTVRDGIYLPQGETWIDYWTGKRYEGGQVLNGHPAPLDQLPIFVRAGSLVPMGPIARNASLVPEDAPLTLSVYPSGQSTFTLYEDDKVTRQWRQGEYSHQEFAVDAPQLGAGDVTVTIGQRTGSYDGMADSRPYLIEAHTGSAPSQVTVGGTTIEEFPADSVDPDTFGSAGELGWYFADGVVHVSVGLVAAGNSTTVTLQGSSAVGGTDPGASAAQVRVDTAEEVFQGEETTVTATFENTGTGTKTDVTLTPVLPEGWQVTGSEGAQVSEVPAGASITATFAVVPGTGSDGGMQTVQVEADYTSASGRQLQVTGGNRLNVAYGSLQAAFNAVSITDAEHASAGDFDGGGNTFAAEAIADAGVAPGGTMTLGEGESAVTYDWPESTSSANSLQPAGQRIALSGSGTHLSILGSAAAGNGASPKITVVYEDGTTSTGTVFFPNWLPQSDDLGGAQVAVASMGRHNSSGELEYTDYAYQIYENSLTLIPGKTVRAVKMPTAPSVRMFSWQIVDRPLPEAPAGENWLSDLQWVSASNGWGVIGIDSAVKASADAPDEPLTSLWVDPATGEHRTYEKGLGVHANGKIRYYLGGNCSRFTTEATQQIGFEGNVVFSVEGDGRVLFSGRTLTGEMAPEEISVDVTGVQYLDLIISAPNGIGAAHGIWGAPKVVCADAVPEVPLLTGIEVTSPPDTVEYTQGEELDLTGLVVTATYDDGSTEVVANEDLTVRGYDPQTLGEQTVTLTYTQPAASKQGVAPAAAISASAEFTVTVVAEDGGAAGADGASDADGAAGADDASAQAGADGASAQAGADGTSAGGSASAEADADGTSSGSTASADSAGAADADGASGPDGASAQAGSDGASGGANSDGASAAADASAEPDAQGDGGNHAETDADQGSTPEAGATGTLPDTGMPAASLLAIVGLLLSLGGAVLVLRRRGRTS